MVVCGKNQYSENDKLAILNPVLIIEVLSPSTKSYDRGDKFGYYRQIPSLTEYILIDSTRILVEVWRKNEDGLWTLMQEVKNHSYPILFKSIDFQLTIPEIYEQTDGLLMVSEN